MRRLCRSERFIPRGTSVPGLGAANRRGPVPLRAIRTQTYSWYLGNRPTGYVCEPTRLAGYGLINRCHLGIAIVQPGPPGAAQGTPAGSSHTKVLPVFQVIVLRGALHETCVSRVIDVTICSTCGSRLPTGVPRPVWPQTGKRQKIRYLFILKEISRFCQAPAPPGTAQTSAALTVLGVCG